MPISIKNKEAEELARVVASATGESITEAVIVSLKERLERLKGRNDVPDMVDEILEISRRAAALPDQDDRSADEILGYDEQGSLRSTGGR
jgi:antitoxin VapB